RNDRAVQPPTGRIEENHTPGWSPIQGAFWRAGGIAADFKHEEVLPRFTDEAIAVIRRHAAGTQSGRQPLFLYLAYPAPHTPWLPDQRFRGSSGAGLYGDFAAMVDAEIGRVLAELRRQRMFDRTLLIVTSDNGPVWYPQDVQRFGHDSAGGLRGMKADAWEAGHRMPFLVRWPEYAPAGAVCRQVICFTDVMATLADVWGLPLPENAGADSFSFLPLIREPQRAEPVRGPFVMKSGNGKLTLVRWGRWKLIDGHGSGGFTRPGFRRPEPGEPPGQLYDLAADPGETRNVYAQHPQIVRRLSALMKQIRDAPMSRKLPLPEPLPAPSNADSRR
ncbi:MAG: arylsulfatase, partial [Planctomycetota bacterium]